MPPPLTTPTPSLFPLVPLSLTTIAAFAAAINSSWADLSSLWTRCSSSSSPSPGSSIEAPDLPTPLCFAVTFFQTALASPRGRLEQAAIVAFLAGLATVTALERDKVLRDHRDDDTSPRAASGAAGRERHGGDTDRQGRRGGDLSAGVVANLTVPWLLYNLALGALSWQVLIIPAFVTQSSRRRGGRRRRRKTTSRSAEPGGEAADQHPVSTVSIPLSIMLGLLLPSALLLACPSSPIVILLWLVFPLWISLTRRFVRPAVAPLAPNGHHHPSRLSRNLILYAAPVLASAASHLLLTLHLLLPPLQPANGRAPVPSPLLLLLEIDHAAISAAFLYWVSASSSSSFFSSAARRAVFVTVLSSLVLGPGAGVCLGWACRDDDDDDGHDGRHGSRLTGRDAAAGFKRRRAPRSGNFFGGPDA